MNAVISIDLSPTGGMLATGSGDWQARICACFYFLYFRCARADDDSDAAQGATARNNDAQGGYTGVYLDFFLCFFSGPFWVFWDAL